MNTLKWPEDKKFVLEWIGATVIGWFIGIVSAIILSYLVINPIYPKETNLIVGLCIGAAVGLSQKIAARQWITLSKSWVWGAMVGIGFPFVVSVFIEEVRPGVDESWKIPLIAAGSILCGLLQLPALRSLTPRAYWWILASGISWSFTFLIIQVGGSVGFLGGGLVLGILSCVFLFWLGPSRESDETADSTM